MSHLQPDCKLQEGAENAPSTTPELLQSNQHDSVGERATRGV